MRAEHRVSVTARAEGGREETRALRGVIAERWLRQPKSSFVYSIEM